jgi:hypothetical protein
MVTTIKVASSQSNRRNRRGFGLGAGKAGSVTIDGCVAPFVLRHAFADIIAADAMIATAVPAMTALPGVRGSLFLMSPIAPLCAGFPG